MITVNPGEMHDGDPVQGQAWSWRMLYLDPDLVARALPEELRGGAEIGCPVVGDPLLTDHFIQSFASLTAPIPSSRRRACCGCSRTS